MYWELENIKVSMFTPLDGKVHTVDLIRQLSDRTILFFYPADFSVVCPTELAELNKKSNYFSELGANILVVSRDSHYTHKQRISTEESLAWFSLPMISDRDGAVAELFPFGLIDQETKNYARATVVFDKLGNVVYVEIHPASVGRNILELLRKMRALTYVKQNPWKLCQEWWEWGDTGLEDSLKHEKIPRKFLW